MDGHPSGPAVLAVDLAHQHLDAEFELHVLRNIFTARHHDLSHGQATEQIGTHFQKPLKRNQAFGNSFGVVQPVYSQDDSRCAEAPLDHAGNIYNAGLRRLGCDLLKIDTDRVRSDAGRVPLYAGDQRFTAPADPRTTQTPSQASDKIAPVS